MTLTSDTVSSVAMPSQTSIGSMINPVCATYLYLSGLVLPICLVSFLLHLPAKENVARIMYTLLMRSHWMIMLPKAEQDAWWVGHVVGLTGKADFTDGWCLAKFLRFRVYCTAHC